MDFANGTFVEARITTEEVLNRADVTYRGAVNRLRRSPSHTSWSYLRVLFENAAARQGGRYQETGEGTFINPDEVLEATNEKFRDHRATRTEPDGDTGGSRAD